MRSLTRIPFLPAAVAALVLLALVACSGVGSSGSTPAPQGSPTVPVNAPAEVFETIDIGDQSGVAGERPQVFKLDTQAGWEELWSRHQANVSPAPGVPDVDFSREMVIAAVDQTDPSGGYRFEITGIEEVEGRLLVRVSKQSPGPDCIVTAVITQPFHVVRMAKSDLEPDLLITEEIYSCG
jgi:hypothetical protein